LESLREDYIRTARSKGLKPWIVLIKHAIPNSLIPVVTFMGLRFGYMLADSVLVETVFSRPGLGKLVVNSIEWQDYPLIQGSVLAIAIFFGVSNMLVDVICIALDPTRRNS
jgi:ABC-type dipeptide/oligopeptide/nickel transport system permease component